MIECEESVRFQPFQQSAPYAAAAAACGAAVDWRVFDEGRALVVRRGRVQVIQRGPLWHEGVGPRDKARALRRLARWPGLTLVTPETRVCGFGLIPVVTPMHHALWPLGPGLQQNLSGKWRNRLTKAENAGLRVSSGDGCTFDCLIRMEAQQRQVRGYQSLPTQFSQALPKPALRLWQWRNQGGCAAAMAFVMHGSSATYHLGWASDAARQAGVHTAMLFLAAIALHEEGIRWVDLGSIDTDRAPGLARFKLGTGATLTALGATLLVLP
jgi:hypothetical protein